MNNAVLGKVFLGGKTLKELKFPEDWTHDPLLFRWKSENHYMMIRPLETSGKWGEPYKQYLYIKDYDLVDIPPAKE